MSDLSKQFAAWLETEGKSTEGPWERVAFAKLAKRLFRPLVECAQVLNVVKGHLNGHDYKQALAALANLLKEAGNG